MEMGIAGKVAIVSGGSRGIGRAIAEELASEGAKLAIGARPSKGLADGCGGDPAADEHGGSGRRDRSQFP